MPRGRKRRRVAVGADREGVRQFAEQREHDGAGAGAEIGDTQRDAPRARPAATAASARSTTVSVSGRGTSTAGESAKRQAPEFLDAEDAGDRLAGKAPRRQRLDGRDLGGIERPLADAT